MIFVFKFKPYYLFSFNHAKVEHNKTNVFPVPVGDSIRTLESFMFKLYIIF